MTLDTTEAPRRHWRSPRRCSSPRAASGRRDRPRRAPRHPAPPTPPAPPRAWPREPRRERRRRRRRAARSTSPARRPSSRSRPRVAEALKAANPGFNYTVEGPAPATASSASAPARPTSATPRARSRTRRPTLCATTGIEYIELKIAFDGLTVMTIPANTAVTCLSFADLYALIGPESHGLRQVDRRAGARHGARLEHDLPGRSTSRSPAPARSRARSTASSSSSSTPIATSAAAAEDAATTRPDYTASRQRQRRSSRASPAPPSSLGWVGFAFAEENKDKVKELERRARTPNGTCVAPTRRDDRRRQLPALPRPVHLREQGQGGREPGRRGLRRLLPRRRHHRDGPRDRPVREPAGRRARRPPRAAWDGR